MTGLPLSPRMSYGQMRMALYQVAPDLHVASARLPGKLDGAYTASPRTRCSSTGASPTRANAAPSSTSSSTGNTETTPATVAAAANSNNDADARPRYCLSTRPNTLWPNACMTATRTR